MPSHTGVAKRRPASNHCPFHHWVNRYSQSIQCVPNSGSGRRLKVGNKILALLGLLDTGENHPGSPLIVMEARGRVRCKGSKFSSKIFANGQAVGENRVIGLGASAQSVDCFVSISKAQGYTDSLYLKCCGCRVDGPTI